MTLPANFNDWEHLQSTVVNVFTKIIRSSFKDLGDTWQPDITTSRGSLRVACTPKDNDTAPMLILRILFFYLLMQRIEDVIEPWYGIPVENHQQNVEHKPQICLYFREDGADVDLDYRPLRMQITFRLMDETSSSITKSELTTMATKIKTLFCTGNGYTFKKGKDLFTYTDLDKGYNLQLYAFSETEAKSLIDKILDIQNHSFDNEYFTIHTAKNPTGKYPTIPPSKTILGEALKMPRRRPVGTVRFQYAVARVWGKKKPVVLVDRSFRFLDPLVEVDS